MSLGVRNGRPPVRHVESGRIVLPEAEAEHVAVPYYDRQALENIGWSSVLLRSRVFRSLEKWK
jgi:hypothetical protein